MFNSAAQMCSILQKLGLCHQNLVEFLILSMFGDVFFAAVRDSLDRNLVDIRYQ